MLSRTGYPGIRGIRGPHCLARVGHALSLARCSPEDVAAGDKLLALAPEGISEGIRGAGYGANNYTHEVVAETYALMMARRVRGHRDKPTWLDDTIYNLLKRVTGWVD
jgi:hypothetical protein